MGRFRGAALYERLIALQEQYLDQVDAILGGLETPRDRLASVEEIRRQVGCVMAEVTDRKRIIEQDIATQAVHDEWSARVASQGETV